MQRARSRRAGRSPTASALSGLDRLYWRHLALSTMRRAEADALDGAGRVS